MSLFSMTGFGRGVAEGENYTVTTEIKSVNHRFKDVRFKMSSLFNGIEMELKKTLFSQVKRGTFDVYINYKKAEQSSRFDDLDAEKVQAYLDRFKEIVGEGQKLKVSPTDFLRSEFFKDNDLSQDPELNQLAQDSFKGALEKLMESRSGEGEKLKSVILAHKSEYESYFQKIEGQSELFQSGMEEKLRKRFEEYKDEVKVDEPRFMQEVVFYLEKLDIHEEINRIKSHLEKLDSIIMKGGEVGRQIDFLMQELNRETNTIGSKSASEEISSSVVQMKVQLEKIREQGLNLE